MALKWHRGCTQTLTSAHHLPRSPLKTFAIPLAALRIEQGTSNITALWHALRTAGHFQESTDREDITIYYLGHLAESSHPGETCKVQGQLIYVVAARTPQSAIDAVNSSGVLLNSSRNLTEKLPHK